MKLTGLKKAVGEYQWAKEEGGCWYGNIMFDISTGELWTDTFHSLGRNEWKEYHNTNIIDISAECCYRGQAVNMKNIKEIALELMKSRKN